MRRTLTILLLLAGCDGSAADLDGSTGSDAGAAGDGGVFDAGEGTDAGPPEGDAGPPVTETSVRCWGFDAPTITVTRDSAGGGDEAMLRLELAFEGGASGIAIEHIVQTDASDAEVRRWDPASLTPPDGFTGRADTRDGVPEPRVIWTATDAATASELALCEQPWHSRAGGRIDVTGRTDAGPFDVSCSLDWQPRGVGEQLRFACARGVTGYLPDAYDAISDITDPVDWVLLGTRAEAYGNADAPIEGLVATEVEVRSYLDTTFDPHCSEPSPLWSPSGGTHTLWRGMTSEDVYAGPVAPGRLERFWWDYQQAGSAAPGYCVPPDDGSAPPDEYCSPPALQIVVRGTSSAGPWEWESDAFTCLDLAGI